MFRSTADLKGNGHINRGDSVVFTTGRAEGFLPNTNYNVNMIMKFNPTGGEVARTSISG